MALWHAKFMLWRPLNSPGADSGDKMSKHLQQILVFFLIMFSAVSIIQADEYQKNEFSISLPSGWIEMPRDIIDSYEKALSKAAPDFPLQHYDYGFQRISSKNWFEYPYILIQVKNTGRIPENELKKLDQISVQKDIDVQKEQVKSLMSEIQTGKMVFDQQNRIIWMRIEGNVANIGPIAGLTSMIPTEKGIIQVNGYSLKSEYPEYDPIFRSIALSTAPVPNLLYKAKWSDNVPSAIRGINWAKVAGKTILWGMIGGVIGLMTYRRRKKEK